MPRDRQPVTAAGIFDPMTPLTLPLQTARLALRPHHESDVDALHRIYSQPDVARYLLEDPWTPSTAAEKVSKRLARMDLDGPDGALALVIERELAPIGDVALWYTDRECRVAEIGWVLDPDHGGQGFAVEAVRSVLDLAFDHYRLHRVAAQMDARNTASAKLAASAGMRHEAHLRQNWWSKGEWTDTAIFGMLAADRE